MSMKVFRQLGVYSELGVTCRIMTRADMILLIHNENHYHSSAFLSDFSHVTS